MTDCVFVCGCMRGGYGRQAVRGWCIFIHVTQEQWETAGHQQVSLRGDSDWKNPLLWTKSA